MSLEMEERLAASSAGYTWAEYQLLPGADKWIMPDGPQDSKASVLVTYRAKNMLEAIQYDK